MSVGFPFFDPRAKPLSSNGAPQAGCYYCFFLTGTLTPANVYADNLVTPLSQPAPASVNPVGGTVSDSAGRFVVMYLDPSVTYRAQLYTAAGVLLEDTDPYKAPGSPAVAFSNGTAAAPGIAFTNYLNTGLYIPSANSLGFATNGLAAGSISQNQAWSIPAANGAVSMTIAGASGQYTEVLNGNSTSGQSFGLEISAGSTVADVALLVQNQAAGATFFELFGDGHGTLGPTSILGLSWNTAGTFTATAPANAPGLQINGNSTSGQSDGLLIASGTTSADYALLVENQAASSTFFKVQGDGQTYVTAPTAATAGPTGTFQVGYVDLPQTIVGASNYNTAMADRGKHIYHAAAGAQTFTINDATVNYPVGAALTFINELGASALTIALQTTATNLIWAAGGGTGNRSLAAAGIATAIKVVAGTPGTWIISGTGLS